ncbi:MAG: hypothetical protein QM690_15065, partial [Sphingobium sp.]
SIKAERPLKEATGLAPSPAARRVLRHLRIGCQVHRPHFGFPQIRDSRRNPLKVFQRKCGKKPGKAGISR